MNPNLHVLETPDDDGTYTTPCTISYLGEGTISFSDSSDQQFSPIYNASTHQITLGVTPGHEKEIYHDISWNGTVYLSESLGYSESSLNIRLTESNGTASDTIVEET